MSSIIAQEKKMQVICFTIHKVVLLCSPLVFPKSIGEKKTILEYVFLYVRLKRLRFVKSKFTNN